MMIRTVLTLSADAETAEQLKQHYRDAEVMANAIRHAGALSSELCVSTADPGDIIVLALWPDEAAYETWINHPVRDQVTAEIRQFMPSMSGKVYQVEDSVDLEDLTSS